MINASAFYENPHIHSIEVSRLKGIGGLAPLVLDTTPLVALTGVNGCGKSTLLHALACVYAPCPTRPRTDFKFPRFFLPTTDATWQGSSFKVVHSYQIGGLVTGHVEIAFGKANDRWTPRYERRPQRFVEYIGIDTCVPSIEQESRTSFLDLPLALPRQDDLSRQIREAASRVLNRDYSSISVRSSAQRKFYRGVECRGVGYSSLSMGAGEQRVFEILERLFKAPQYSLILIDEIDLLLHEDALRRLLKVISRRAGDKSIQVIFTTHRESVLSNVDVTAQHLFQAEGKTLTMPATHPDVWHRLTGDSVRSLEVFVEDDLAKAIVARVAHDLGLRKHVEVVITGAAANLFTLAGGLALRGQCFENKRILLDGDVFLSEESRRSQVNKVITGHGLDVERHRANVLGW